MAKSLKNKLITFLAIFLIFFGAFAMLYGIYRGYPSWIFWFCYISMILIGIGALRKDSLLIAAQFNLLFFPLLFWNIDFFLVLFSGNSYLGIAGYFFEEMLLPARIISLEHLFLIPMILYLLYLIKIKKKDILKSYIISIFQVSLIFAVMKILNANIDNVNCVFENCYSFLNFLLPYASYTVLWFLVYFIILFVANIVLYFVSDTIKLTRYDK